MRLEFLRDDLVVQIDKDAVAIVSGKTVDRFNVEDFIDLATIMDQSNAVRHWVTRLADTNYRLLHRICLDIRDRQQQAPTWEIPLLAFIHRFQPHPPITILRVSPVRARSANIPFTVPLRFIEVNAPHEYIRSSLNKVFHGELEEYEAALRTLKVNWEPWDQFALPRNWPTAEVLHFNGLPQFPEEQMLSGDAATPGTLGWLLEKLVTWQVRLVVISCDPEELAQMRVFASALLARGGPAVLVEALYTPTQASSNPRRVFYDIFYERLIHDAPLDDALQSSLSSDLLGRFQVSLFAGGGREEQLRSSNIAKRLAEFGAEKSRARRLKTLDQWIVQKAPVERRREVRRSLDHRMQRFTSEWRTSRFEFHEGEGLLPLSYALASVRTNLTGPVVTSYSPPPDRQARYVNCSFWEEATINELRQIDQRTGNFKQGQLYQLGIQIGPKSRSVFTLNETALVEEVFKWDPEMKGVWIEIGVTGIDFEVVGDPVQRVWLPAPGKGPTDTVYFAVVPRKSGVNRLRFAIYYEQNVIQSFRVGLITGWAIKNKRRALAKALEIRSRLSANLSFLPVLEFSLTPSIDKFAADPSHAKRAVAIIANEMGGDSVVTVKDASSFGVTVAHHLPGEVKKLQKELLAISRLDQENPSYPFTLENEGTQADLESTLRTLADRGVTLFQSLINRNAWEGIRKALELPDQIIHVAQILRLKVIPWSFVYTRALDPRPGDRDQNGKLTNIPVCLAPLPDAQGELPVKRCGSSQSCMLQTNPALKPENVVCPLEFWGFKHVVEIPPKQIDTNAKSSDSAAAQASAVETVIKVNGSARVVAGANSSLGPNEHFPSLARLKTRFPLDTLEPQYTFAGLRTELAASPFHIAYFFCHAQGGEEIDTRIVLQAAQSAPEFVLAYQIGNLSTEKKWDQPPALVFLNACRSTNYSPEALSPFLRTFIDILGASGLIGTEVDVWNFIAAEVGQVFL